MEKINIENKYTEIKKEYDNIIKNKINYDERINELIESNEKLINENNKLKEENENLKNKLNSLEENNIINLETIKNLIQKEKEVKEEMNKI